MSIFSRINQVLTSLVSSADPNYSTIVYPTRGVGIIIHDGLRITGKSPWCHRLVTRQESTTCEPELYEGEGAQAQDQHSVELCDHEQEESEAFDLYTFCGIGGALDDNNTGLLENTSHGGMSVGVHFIDVNPGTGLPMLNGSVDVAGNPFGYSSDGFSSDPFDHGWLSGCDHNFSSGLDESFSAGDDGFSSDF